MFVFGKKVSLGWKRDKSVLKVLPDESATFCLSDENACDYAKTCRLPNQYFIVLFVFGEQSGSLGWRRDIKVLLGESATFCSSNENVHDYAKTYRLPLRPPRCEIK